MVTTAIDVFSSTISIDGTAIGGIDDETIPFPEGGTGTKDISTQDSGTVGDKGLKRFVPGSVTLTGVKIPGDAGQIALYAALADRKAHTITVNIPAAGEIYTSQAFVTDVNTKTKDNTLKFSAKIDFTGTSDLDTTYAGITSIVTNPAGVNIPTSLGTGGFLVNEQITGTSSVTLNVTAAGATGIAYSTDSGTTWTALTTGTPSSSITLGAAGTLKEIMVRVAETSKATRFVKVLVARA